MWRAAPDLKHEETRAEPSVRPPRLQATGSAGVRRGATSHKKTSRLTPAEPVACSLGWSYALIQLPSLLSKSIDLSQPYQTFPATITRKTAKVRRSCSGDICCASLAPTHAPKKR